MNMKYISKEIPYCFCQDDEENATIFEMIYEEEWTKDVVRYLLDAQTAIHHLNRYVLPPDNFSKTQDANRIQTKVSIISDLLQELKTQLRDCLDLEKWFGFVAEEEDLPL